MHPLRYFADSQVDAPGIAEGAFIFPVRCKTGLGVARRPTAVHAHYIKSAAGILHGGRIRYAARWLCSTPGSADVTLLPVAHRFPMCQLCVDRLHPVLYRCFDADGGLLYVGSTGARDQAAP